MFKCFLLFESLVCYVWQAHLLTLFLWFPQLKVIWSDFLVRSAEICPPYRDGNPSHMPVHHHLYPHPRPASPPRLSLTMIGVLSPPFPLPQPATEQVNIGIPSMETLICYGILSWENVYRSMHTSSIDYFSCVSTKALAYSSYTAFCSWHEQKFAASTDFVYQLKTCIFSCWEGNWADLSFYGHTKLIIVSFPNQLFLYVFQKCFLWN